MTSEQLHLPPLLYCGCYLHGFHLHVSLLLVLHLLNEIVKYILAVNVDMILQSSNYMRGHGCIEEDLIKVTGLGTVTLLVAIFTNRY